MALHRAAAGGQGEAVFGLWRRSAALVGALVLMGGAGCQSEAEVAPDPSQEVLRTAWTMPHEGFCTALAERLSGDGWKVRSADLSLLGVGHANCHLQRGDGTVMEMQVELDPEGKRLDSLLFDFGGRQAPRERTDVEGWPDGFREVVLPPGQVRVGQVVHDDSMSISSTVFRWVRPRAEARRQAPEVETVTAEMTAAVAAIIGPPEAGAGAGLDVATLQEHWAAPHAGFCEEVVRRALPLIVERSEEVTGPVEDRAASCRYATDDTTVEILVRNGFPSGEDTSTSGGGASGAVVERTTYDGGVRVDLTVEHESDVALSEQVADTVARDVRRALAPEGVD